MVASIFEPPQELYEPGITQIAAKQKAQLCQYHCRQQNWISVAVGKGHRLLVMRVFRIVERVHIAGIGEDAHLSQFREM